MPARDERPGTTERELQGADAEGYYARRKAHYQAPDIAERYDERRFAGARASRNAAKWRAISSALSLAEGSREVLDLPTGTGRFVGSLLDAGRSVVGADISREMMSVARDKASAQGRAPLGFVQADAEALPFRDGAFDCCISIRFFLHLTPAVRANVLRELARVSRRWVIADYRHRHAPRHVLRRLAHRMGLRGAPPPRVDRAQVEQEAAAAGLRVVEIIPVTRVFSDKWIVLCERA